MEEDDPRRPLLGARAPRDVQSTMGAAAARWCGVDAWRRRLPITIWITKYNWDFLLRDFIAGTTVALTSIPQGIAYAMIAGVPPQVGLYSSIFPGIVYALFGSCKVVTVGPTAILAALLSKYVAYSVDFAYLAAFLSGCVILLLGVLQLGFLLDFISKPVISGFTTAAAMQIAAAQLKSLFRVAGSSGNTFIDAVINFFKHIATVQLWDSVLGVACILALIALKHAAPSPGGRGKWRQAWVHGVRARNALVVLAATVLAYGLSAHGDTPFALTGTIQGGLPRFGPPPFSTTVGNQTLGLDGMLAVFGAEGLVMPLVAVLESIAIAKAFACGSRVDATQEMVALGACNLLASFAQCMPATGSFTRTALNHASGVATQAGSLFKASVVLLAVTLLTRAFYFIPRAALAAVILVAMASIVEFAIARLLWRNSKVELLVWLVTVVVGATLGLEYGILAGAASDALRALAASARPPIHHTHFKVGNVECVCVTVTGPLWYACAATMARRVEEACARAGGEGDGEGEGQGGEQAVVIDGRHLGAMDCGVAENLISTTLELEGSHRHVLLWNFPEHCLRLLDDLHPEFSHRCVSGPSIDQHILGLAMTRLDDNITIH